MERICVTVRARPLSAEDMKASPWRISDNSISNLSGQPAKFEFDRIFGEQCSTTEVYEARTKEIVASAVRGFNGTVFAYGQTNSGKTYTMRGPKSEPGIISLAVHDLFQSIQEDVEREFLVRMSYMEIYNEEINDLLAPEHRRLQIHENFERGIYVAGLREEIISSPEQVLEFMEFGESHRHIGETNMNIYSSRSHTIFRMIVESRVKVEDGDTYNSCDAVRVSVLNLVDLAGSERAAKTGAEGMRLKEGSHINKSLMTLGTVINKLSEGTESQGGHVPYRDSKLTRILQPALGGNSNTAIICTITLAQIHMDETKSSLQFASRALRVKNCACVNEILTDAALLKRQRKEIEELRAKLLGSHSDHLEEEILNLRNTLLQSELEKERITLELEVEKKAKVLRERRLQEQARKIANLSSLVLCSERDVKDTYPSKNRRRVTWCPQSSQRSLTEVSSSSCLISAKRFDNTECAINFQVPFDELLEESEASLEDQCSDYNPCDETCMKDEFPLPDAQALLHVTSRKKSKSIRHTPMLQTESCGLQGLTERESEAVLMIKRLESQISSLELEKLTIQRNLDDVIDLAAKQNISFREQYESLQQEVVNVHEKAGVGVAYDAIPTEAEVGGLSHFIKLQVEIESFVSEAFSLRNTSINTSSILQDSLQDISLLSKMILELKSFAFQYAKQFNCILDGCHQLHNSMKNKIDNLEEREKLLHDQCIKYQLQVEEVNSDRARWEMAVNDRDRQYELEKDELVGQISHLQKDVFNLSSSSLTRERDALRKELDKTKLKLKDTESKLKISIQEKIKLEGERAQAEREIKHLHSQKALLERDILKRDTVSNKPKECNFSLERSQDYQKLEHYAMELEAMVDPLKEALVATVMEKEAATSMAENLDLEMKDRQSEIEILLSEISILKTKLGESESCSKRLESSLECLGREKEEMENVVTDALLEVEVEKAALLAKDTALSESKRRLEASSDDILRLSKELEELKSEFEVLASEHKLANGEVQRLQGQLDDLAREQSTASACSEDQDALTECSNCNKAIFDLDESARRVSMMEAKMQEDSLKDNLEKTKLRMRLRSTQAKLDAYRGRYAETFDEMRLMNEKYKEASTKLKQQLGTYGLEILKLKKQLTSQRAADS